MNLLRALIVRFRSGPDYVSLETDLPEAVHPFSEHLFLTFTAKRFGGEAFVKEHFPNLPIETVPNFPMKVKT